MEGEKDISTYTAYVGQGSPRFWLGLNPQLPNEAFAEIVIVSKDVEARERDQGARLSTRSPMARSTRHACASIASISVRRSASPSSSASSAPTPARCARSPTRCVTSCGRTRTSRSPQLDWNEQSPYLKLVVDQDRARALGLTPQDVSQALAMLISGAPVTTIRDGIEKVGVVARAVPSERLDLGRVGDLTITSRNGVAVPLQQIAKIEYAHEEPILWRRNRDMAITVRSDVVDGVQAPDVTNRISPELQEIRDHLEPAYRIEPGGAFEESAKGNASIFVLFPLMVDRDADAADDPAAELLAPVSGVPHGAARHCRRLARAERRQPAVRLRGAARTDRAGRDDHAQRGDPGRPDRDRRLPRPDRARKPSSRPPSGAPARWC